MVFFYNIHHLNYYIYLKRNIWCYLFALLIYFPFTKCIIVILKVKIFTFVAKWLYYPSFLDWFGYNWFEELNIIFCVWDKVTLHKKLIIQKKKQEIDNLIF